MKGLIITFLGVFFFIWGFGSAVSCLQNMQRRSMFLKTDYGDFSPQKVESERKKAMDDYHQQTRDYKNQQDAQKRLIEDQKRQLKDMQRMNQAH